MGGWGGWGHRETGDTGQGLRAWGQARGQAGRWSRVPWLQGIAQGPEKGRGPAGVRRGWGRLRAPGASHGANSAPSIRRDESNKLL